VSDRVPEEATGVDVGVGDRGYEVRVGAGDGSYDVRVGSALLGSLSAMLENRAPAHRYAVISDDNIAPEHGTTVLDSLTGSGFDARLYVFPAGEASKTRKNWSILTDAMLDDRHGRDSCVVAVGGGVTGDLAGFVAATYLRGIPFVQVPTTILSMVDASIGGKTAVNLPQGKNLVGAFHQPCLVWIDTGTLVSLPRRDRAAGMAEVVKAGAIWDARYFARLEREHRQVMDLEPASLVRVLERGCRIKAEVVSQDEREESGVRALLNFGHTLAHAIEAQMGYDRILHGEAVSIGMVHAARRSEVLGHAPAGTSERLEDLLGSLQLPTEIPGYDRKAHLSAIRVDKKKVGQKIHYVVLRRIGQADTVELTPAQILPVRGAKG